jgi:prolyl 4-hydroxylase
METNLFVLVISIDSYIFYILFVGILLITLFFALYPSYLYSFCPAPVDKEPLEQAVDEEIIDHQIPHAPDTIPTETRMEFSVEDIIEDEIEIDNYTVSETTDSKGRRVVKHLFGDYELQEIYGILTAEECDKMIDLGKKKGMDQSHVSSYDKYMTKLDTTSRISSQAWLTDSYDPLTQRFAEISAEITGLPIENQEEVQIASYQVGGKFEAHFDACREGQGYEYCLSANGTAGERTATLLVYLNDEFEGGQTVFTAVDFKVKPEKGKGILFYNIDKLQKPLPKSMHMGAEVLKGEKWIATKWTHLGDFKNRGEVTHQE